MRNSIESERPNVEQESKKYHSRIVLNFFRHGDKPKTADGQADEEVRLTPTGRQQAWLASDKYHSEGASEDTSLAIGGPRQRSEETAAWVMAGDRDELRGDETLEELKAILDADQKYGSKVGIDDRLNFKLGNGKFSKELNQAYGADKNGLRWLVDKSDALARETGETDVTSYSTGARQIAEMIKKYETIAPRFDALVEKYENEREEDTLQRFFGSHLSVPDAFLAKLIENKQGVEERDRFIAAMDNHGLDFVEGFQVEIKTETPGGKPAVEIHFEKKGPDGQIIYKFDQILDDKDLNEIIKQDKETFNP